MSQALRAQPSLSGAAPVLTATHIVKEFPVKGGRHVSAVDDVSFELYAGETLGIVGESGSGKSTLARVLTGLEPPTSGSASLGDLELFGSSRQGVHRARRIMQMVFQDPFSSLDPRMSVFQLVSEPWLIHHDVVAKGDRRAKAADLLTKVGLDPSDMDKTARAFSGGQRQRIGIARALALSPRVLVLDEPVSALDVSIQAQIVELLRDLQDDFGLAMIFIAHDLAVVRSLTHRVAVMYMGRIVETGIADDVYGGAKHPYTRALLSSVPRIREERTPTRIKLLGEVPSAIDPPSGCRFRTRCWKAQDICAGEAPPLVVDEHGHWVACYFPELDAAPAASS
jgi:oligopeptide/dipeptide ABC transporter ATP-binding protein